MPRPARSTTLLLRPAAAIATAPRVQLLTTLAEWLTPRLPILIPGLPTAPIRVAVPAAPSLGGGKIASYSLGSRAYPARRWQVNIAYGSQLATPLLVEAWCVSLVHELLHLRDFHVAFGGRLPIDLDWATELPRWTRDADAAEDGVEEDARDVIRDLFAPAHLERLADPALQIGVTQWRRANPRPAR